MRSLIWKEWHEQSWKIAFSCVVLGAFVLIGLRARIIADQTMVLAACYIGIGLLPVLTSSGLVPAERNEGSMEMLLSLPLSPLRILLVKTVMGVLACELPLVLAAAVSSMMAHGREMDTHTMLAMYGRAMLATLAIFVWMEALTVRLPTETRAGLLGVGVLLFWGLATEGLQATHNPWAMAISPFGFLYRMPVMERGYPPQILFIPARLIFVILIQAPIAALLWIWAANRFANVPEEQP